MIIILIVVITALIICCLCTSLFVALVIKGRDNKGPRSAYNLDISRTVWSGWDINPLSNPDVEHYDINNDLEYITLEGFTEKYRLEILDYNDDEIELSIQGLALLKENGSINLGDCSKKSTTFNIRSKKSATLGTCTMDGGIHWEIEYEALFPTQD